MELFSDLLSVTLAGLLLGAGLPILFAIGIKLTAPAHADGAAESQTSGQISPLRRGAAGLIFLVIILAVIIGLLWITQGRLYETFGWDLFGSGGTSGH